MAQPVILPDEVRVTLKTDPAQCYKGAADTAIDGMQVLQMRPGHAARMRHQVQKPAARTLPALVPSHGRRVTCALIGTNEPASSCPRNIPNAGSAAPSLKSSNKT